MDKIHPIWLVPYDYISCPSCGRVYGHHKTKVHVETEECSSCRPGEEYMEADEFIRKRCLK